MDEKIITPVEEDIDVGLSSHTLDIKLKLTMRREAPDASFNYNVDVDELGQIVFTPEDTTTSFTEITASTNDVEEVINDNEKTFSLNLTADLMFEDDNQTDPSWESNIDEVGQAVIYPIEDRASFLTVSIKDSLNLITEEQEEKTINSTSVELHQTSSPDEEVKEEPSSQNNEEETSPEISEEEKIQNIVDNVKAEVTESLDEPHTFNQVISSLKTFTEDFKKESGTIKTGYLTEAIFTQKILEKYYTNVISSVNEDWTTIVYDNKFNNSLTEDIDPKSPEFITKKEIAEEVIDDIEENLKEILEKLEALERLFREIGIHSEDIKRYFTNYIEQFISSEREISCIDFRNRLEEYANNSVEAEEIE